MANTSSSNCMSLLLSETAIALRLENDPPVWVVNLTVVFSSLAHIDEDQSVAIVQLELLVANLTVCLLEALIEAEVLDEGRHDGVIVPLEVVG